MHTSLWAALRARLREGSAKAWTGSARPRSLSPAACTMTIALISTITIALTLTPTVATITLTTALRLAIPMPNPVSHALTWQCYLLRLYRCFVIDLTITLTILIAVLLVGFMERAL